MNSQRKVFLIPKEYIKPDRSSDGGLEIVSLRCPRTGNAAKFFLDPLECKIFEILQFHEDKSSWFIDDSVEKDGSLYMATPIDALFLALPYLTKSKMFSPLDQLFVDTEFPHCKRLVQCCLKTIDLITDNKDIESTAVYRYNEQKTLEWLRRKVEKVVEMLNAKGIDCSSGAKSANLVQKKQGSNNDDPHVLIYAYGIVCEYLEGALAQKLSEVLRIKDALQNVNMEDSKENPKKKVKPSEIVEPSEDYFDQFSYTNTKAKKTAKLTASQKKLMKVDKTGMKNISSFFGGQSSKK